MLFKPTNPALYCDRAPRSERDAKLRNPTCRKWLAEEGDCLKVKARVLSPREAGAERAEAMVLQKEQAPLSDPLLIRPPHGEGVVPSFPRLSNALPFTIFQTGSKRFSRGFTLAEVLAALAFMAIVLPVAVEGLRIANSAGVVAERKMAATEIADRVLNEAILTGQWQSGSLSGSIWRENLEFPYALRTEAWTADPMRLNLQIVTVQVTFSVQGRPYDVNLSTLAGGGAL